jgi:hypothetical protein
MAGKRWILLWIITTVTVIACEKTPPPEDKNLDRLVQQSTYIFSGAVEKPGAATMESVPVNDNTAIVKISQVYTPADILGDLTGRQVTVQLKQGTPMGTGEKAVFFTNGWIYGKSIAFMEVGRMKEDQGDKLKTTVDESLQRKADQQLKARLDRATLVVLAKIVKTDALKLEKPLPISEHNPDWRQAVLQINSVLKGEHQGQELTIIYPGSGDEAWMASPKPKPEQQGIWILQKDQQEKGGPKFNIPGYTALDALDFQPMDQVDRVKRLIGTK